MEGCRWCGKDLFELDSDHAMIRAAERRADFVGEVFWDGCEKQVKEISIISIAVRDSSWTADNLVQFMR